MERHECFFVKRRGIELMKETIVFLKASRFLSVLVFIEVFAIIFCLLFSKRNWTKEDWKKLFSSDETVVVIQSACKIQTWGKK